MKIRSAFLEFIFTNTKKNLIMLVKGYHSNLIIRLLSAHIKSHNTMGNKVTILSVAVLDCQIPRTQI